MHHDRPRTSNSTGPWCPIVSENLVNAEFLTPHLNVKAYGRFTLTDAVRPALEIPIRPRAGYRVEVYSDTGLHLPMIHAAASAEMLFELFLDLLQPLGETVHVVLESSHGQPTDRHSDYRRNHIDRSVLASHFYDFEDLLLNDGCTGVAVLSARRPMEVQFDEHKQLTIYSTNLVPFRRILKAHGLKRRQKLRFLSEAEHLHHSTDNYADEFQQLALRIGIADNDCVLDPS
jgi:hypothetical protein